MLEAARIAEINIIRLLNENAAIGLSYGIFRTADLDTTPRNVVFVDFGHSKISAFVAAITKDKVIFI